MSQSLPIHKSVAWLTMVSRVLLTVLAGLLLLGSAASASAQEIFCTVVGGKQGTFQVEGSVGGKTSQIPALFLSQEITRSSDAATGLSMGMLTNKPLTIIKELDSSSIQFFTAAVTNETLRSVTCTFYRAFRGGAGRMQGYFRITLTNANIVDYKDTGDGINGTTPGDEREHISLTYQRIELTDLDTNTSAEDVASTG